jgi:hypothetical protein
MPRDDASGFAGKPAMSGFALASRNSLRALRPLCSNRRDEYVNEALRAERKTTHRRRIRLIARHGPPARGFAETMLARHLVEHHHSRGAAGGTRRRRFLWRRSGLAWGRARSAS